MNKSSGQCQPSSCVWPIDGQRRPGCGRGAVPGLALCPEHVKIVTQAIGRDCAWPGCVQTILFRSLCVYHNKIAAGLMQPYLR
ncbi:MAG: hypothetical protein ACRDJF_07620 [Actinomycetota bacterium]